MSDSFEERAPHRRTHPQFNGCNLSRVRSRERGRATASRTWLDAKTLAKYDDFRVVLTVLRAGMRIPAHKTEGRISIHTVTGHVEVRADGRTFDLTAGRLLTLDRGVPHDVEALEESAFVLTIAWP